MNQPKDACVNDVVAGHLGSETGGRAVLFGPSPAHLFFAQELVMKAFAAGRARFAVAGVAMCLAAASAVTCYAADGPIQQAMKSVGTVFTTAGQGAGFVVEKSTIVVTNYHVVSDADDAFVEFPDGSEILVKGFLLASPEYDLAVLELEKPAPADPLPLCQGHVDVGTDVYAIGAPRGLDGSVSKGIVSAYRKWPDLASFFGPVHEKFGYSDNSKWVQTDAAINHGNSGGPLVLQNGQVVAVNTLGSLPGIDQNINFAVDIAHVRNAVKRLPTRSRSLGELPKRAPSETSSTPIAGGDELDRTMAYWNRMARVLGTYTFEDTTMRAKAFGKSLPGSSNAPKPDKPVGLDDPLFGKTKRDRENRIRRWAGEAGIPYEEALTMDFYDLKDKKDEPKRNAQAAARERVRQQQLAPGLLQLETARRSEQRAAVLKRKFDDLGRQTSQIARKAAADIDALPVDGVNPGVIDFAIDVKSQLREIAVKCDRMHKLAEGMTIAGSGGDRLFADAQQASREMEQAMARLHEIVEVGGSAMETKLSQLYGKDFGSAVQVTEEQGAVLGLMK
jgi:S1-C subfamily serine protease